MIPFIKYFQYLSSRARCAHNFNETYLSTVLKMIAMFCDRVFLLEGSTPPTCPLLLHHTVNRFVGSCSPELRVTFPNEGKLALGYLILYPLYIKKSLMNRLICDHPFFHLCHCDSKDTPDAPM